MPQLTQEEVIHLAKDAGFSGDALVCIVAICRAESGFVTDAVNTEGNTPPSRDRGLVQINDYWHKEVSDACAFDPLCALKAAYDISSRGQDFTPWTTFKGGPFKAYYDELTQQFKELATMTEVAKFVDTSQFYPGKTEVACAFYAVSTAKFAGKDKPQGTSHDVEVWADEEYMHVWGHDTPMDIAGIFPAGADQIIIDAGLHYQELQAINDGSTNESDRKQVQAAINDQRPVLALITEVSVFDLDLNRNPYWWGASMQHFILITGMDNDNTYLCRDSANVTGSLQGPNSVLAGPRRYDATKMYIVWAAMIKLPWQKDIPSGFDPTKGDGMASKIPPSSTAAPTTAPTSTAPDGQLEAAKLEWNSTGTDAPFDTGIAVAWLRDYRRGKFHGPPLAKEYQAHTWSGKHIAVQQFARERCEWDGSDNWH